ncbi:hypothetical protein DSO57_1029903 [Entomophthora muscae]|uniref:Uncharacterized protein n=1 Tax=Entomophthora muscae TaxID=34485 RepID=A0ACC2RFV6_9FUNG|nr:hypothetical protein DSO57_1029903 [Entomophthora muscae]
MSFTSEDNFDIVKEQYHEQLQAQAADQGSATTMVLCVTHKLSPTVNVKVPAATKQTSATNVQTATIIKQTSPTNMQTSAAIKQIHTATMRKPATTKLSPSQRESTHCHHTGPHHHQADTCRHHAEARCNQAVARRQHTDIRCHHTGPHHHMKACHNQAVACCQHAGTCLN